MRFLPIKVLFLWAFIVNQDKIDFLSYFSAKLVLKTFNEYYCRDLWTSTSYNHGKIVGTLYAIDYNYPYIYHKK